MNLYEDFMQFCEDRKYEFPCEDENFYFRAMIFIDDVNFCPTDYECHNKLSAHLFIMREGQKRNDFIWSTKVW